MTGSQKTTPRFTPLVFAGALAFWASFSPAQAAISAPPTVSGHQTCVKAARAAEREHGIAPHLLSAISLVETGRWSRGLKASLAWPWTVMAEGKGRYLPTKAAAIAEVRKLKARGITNIDVGCFQVNLHYHGDAFDGLEQAFDPDENAAYAATFLADLKRRSGTWKLAVGRYHSWDDVRGPAYREKVYGLWYSQREHLAASASDQEIDMRTAQEVHRDSERAQIRADRARERANQSVKLKMIQAQRDANQRFLISQRAIQDARMASAFERRKTRVLDEYEAMLKQRTANQGG
jgi:hypothetical protein